MTYGIGVAKSATQDNNDRLWTRIEDCEIALTRRLSEIQSAIFQKLDTVQQTQIAMQITIARIETTQAEHSRNIAILFEKTKSGSFADSKDVEELKQWRRESDNEKWKQRGFLAAAGMVLPLISAWFYEHFLKGKS